MPAPSLDELKTLVKARTDVDTREITLDSDLQDLGLESRDLAELLGDVEQRYGIRTDASDFQSCTTVGDLYRVLQTRAS